MAEKKKFQAPEVEVINFSEQDIVTTSGIVLPPDIWEDEFN